MRASYFSTAVKSTQHLSEISFDGEYIVINQQIILTKLPKDKLSEDHFELRNAQMPNRALS